MTIFKLEKRVKNLEGKLCCIAHYYDTFEDFPTEGRKQVQEVNIMNAKSNSLIVDANITEVGESIVRNINYK